MNNELHIATAPLFFHTACVCSEKNYRLQDIQLSKNLPSRSRALARQARDFGRRTCYSYSRLPQPKPRITRNLQARQRLVENTGLEPVTSWLQTRRSPS
jgi:hypothetical protein